MEHNTTPESIDDEDDYSAGYSAEEWARIEREFEALFAPKPHVDRSGINSDCNESQPCRGDEPEPEEDDCDFDDDGELDSELDDLPL
jgi:hypothetical protein